LLDWFSAADRGRASACAAAGQVCGALIASAAAFTIGGQVAVVSTLAGVLFLALVLPAAWPRWLSPASVTEVGSEHLAPAAQDHPAGQDSPASQDHPAGQDYRDARFAWAVRAVVTFSNTLLITFVSYYVSDVLHVHRPARFVGLAAGVTSALVLAGALHSGRASDKSGRRRRYVIRAAVVMCAGELLLAFTHSTELTITACALAGYGFGVYLATDQALTAEVLPDARRYGRDIGIMNTSTAAPQVAAPAAAALLLGSTSSYTLLFALGALLTLTGAAFVLPIRKVG
ncbi:MAG TPA: MFS transporter, partial [Streptosporangiaceae bacterium]|nr:MFS transporter [Streptosporangiaceae bacterium]